MSNIELPTGVYPRPSPYSDHMVYYSKIMVGKKTVWLGTFKEVDKAVQAYLTAKREIANGKKCDGALASLFENGGPNIPGTQLHRGENHVGAQEI